MGDSVEKCFDGMKPGELDMLAAGASAKGLRIILAQYMDLVYRQSRNLYDSADIPIEEEHGLFLSRNEVNIRQLLEAGFSFDQYKVLLDIVKGPAWASPPRIAHPFESKEFDTAKRIFELRAEADELESELGYNV